MFKILNILKSSQDFIMCLDEASTSVKFSFDLLLLYHSQPDKQEGG